MHTFDVIVVGGGVIGCAIAHELARDGARTLLLERGELAGGASRASAGMLVPYVEAHERGPLFDLAVKSFELYGAFLERVREDADVPIECRRIGTLQVAQGAARVRELEAGRAWLAAAGVAATWLDHDALGREEPAVTAHALGGLLIEQHAYLRVRQLVAALGAAAARRGTAIRTGEAVDRITIERGRATGVETAAGRYQAGSIVLAAGVWSRAVPDHLPLRPIRGQLAVVRMPRQPVRRLLWDERCYLVPWEDGTVLVGATAEDAGFDERVTTAGLAGLLAAAQAFVPALADATVVDAWVGLRPDTADHLPILGRGSVEGLIYATGHFRNGVLLTPITAKVIGEVVRGGSASVDLQPFAPGRFAGAVRPSDAAVDERDAFAALQQAEREYRQAVAGSLYSGADAVETAELQKDALQRLEDARWRLEDARTRHARKP